MTCLEFVVANLSEPNELLDNLQNNTKIDKSSLQLNDLVVFSQKFHVGFAVLADYYELITTECSNKEIITRTLSLYDDNIKILLKNPTKKEIKMEENKKKRKGSCK